ncbi:MAG: pseudouridine synthase [Oscillospiraceae bacterium]
MAERLQKILSAAGLASRRTAEKWIGEGRVTVNGETAVLGQSADPERDRICLDGKPVAVSGEKTYIMLNKPRGFVTTLSDEKGRPTVAELVRDAGKRLYPVGRLDLDSDGLLLMTDDGELANALMHPSHEIDKTYRTVVSGGELGPALEVLRSPLVIDGYPIRPARVEPAGEEGDRQVLLITIHEGRNRQVRKMCQAAGLRVHRLTRVSEGPLELGTLPAGKWRRLTENECFAIKNVIFGSQCPK